MASAVKTDNTGKYVVVEKGDTLSQIALDYKSTSGNKTYQQLAQLNGISNPNYIRIGQKIYLTKTSGGGSTTTASKSSPKLVLDPIGIQSNGDGKTLFATWTWNGDNTDKFQVSWQYATGDGIAFVGHEGDVPSYQKYSTYSIPAQAYKVMFKVKPIAKLKSDKKTPYWTENWTHGEYVDPSNIIGEAPVPNIEIEDNDITVTISDIDLKALNASGIEIQVGMNDSEIVNSGKAKIDSDTQYASYKCTVAPGNEYKARARAYRNWGGKPYYGEWSNWSSAVGSMPAAPSGITTIKADSKTSVYLKWSAVKNADSYDIEYTTDKKYFGTSDKTTVIKTGSKNTVYYVTGLSTDDEYFFRVRAVKDDVASDWSGVKSIKLGIKPSAPTTWASTTTLTTGDPLTLYWVHNTEGGSSQTKANIVIKADGKTIVDETFDANANKSHTYFTYTAPKELEEGEVVTSSIKFNTSGSDVKVGTKLLWKVRTAGITGEFGDWSIERTVDIYSKVSLSLKVADKNGNEVSKLTSFPFYIAGRPIGSNQSPIGYHVSVISNQTYETIDNVGNPKTINKGEEVYAKYFDTTSFSEKLNGEAYDLVVPMSAGNINVDDGMSYTVQATVTMDSGMTATSQTSFKVSWTEVSYKLNAEVVVDSEQLIAHVKPYAKQYSYVYYKVTKSGSTTKPVYTATNEEIAAVWGMEIPKAITTKGTKIGKQVFEGILADGTEILYYEVEKATSNSDVTLALYRREFDGTFTKLATGINNTKNTFVTDPHPALDYARYRVVATSNSTGAISYYDVPGVPMGEHSVVIQWNDTWVNFDSDQDAPPVHAWSGSMLKIPYNIDIAPRTSKDVSLVNYAGRKHPVVYYGTHVGETDTWNVEIPKDDTDLLYALRRLAIWMDRVYVREPSGSGYWADISVSFSKKHCEVTVPVTFDITRVEGGA